jgi:hypothetical protein
MRIDSHSNSGFVSYTSLSYAADNLRILEAVVEEIQNLDQALKEIRQDDLRYGEYLLRRTKEAVAKKAAMTLHPRQIFSRTNTSYVAPSSSFTDDAPARRADPLEKQVAAGRWAATAA